MATIKRVLNIIFLVIPASLLVLSLYLGLTYGPNGIQSASQNWTTYWHFAYYFYLLTFVAVLILFLKEKQKSFRDFLSAYKFWFVGFVLSAISFAIAGLFTDIGFVLFHLLSQN